MSPKLKSYLDKQGIKYIRIEHSPAFTDEEVAQSMHMTGQLSKTVIVDLDGQMAMAMLPANPRIGRLDLQEVTGSADVKFAPRGEFDRKFPDCKLGAIPPFGNLYGMDVYIAESLARNDEIAFNAGSHSEIVKMSYADFERLVHPKVAVLAA